MGLVQIDDRVHGVVYHARRGREGITEEPGDARSDVDPGSVEFLERDRLDVVDPACISPLRFDAHHREHLRDGLAAGAHGWGPQATTPISSG